MGTLNPKLLSNDMTAVLNSTSDIVKSYSKRVLYPEAVLLALVRSKDTAARRILDYFKEQRGLDLARLERSVKLAVETRRDVDGDLLFLTSNNEQMPLSRQMIVALDEALSIAQASGEVYIDTDHMLAIMADSKLSTGGSLRQFGITPNTI